MNLWNTSRKQNLLTSLAWHTRITSIKGNIKTCINKIIVMMILIMNIKFIIFISYSKYDHFLFQGNILN